MFLLRISLEGPLDWLATLVEVGNLYSSSASSACDYVVFIRFRNRLAGTRFRFIRDFYFRFTVRDACHESETILCMHLDLYHDGKHHRSLYSNLRFTNLRVLSNNS